MPTRSNPPITLAATISAVDLKKEPSEIAAILSQVAQSQTEGTDQDGEFFLTCEIHTTLVSAKKMTQATDLVASVEGDGETTVILSRPINPRDQYPYTYTQVWQRVKAEHPHIKQHQFTSLIRDKQIKGDRKYSYYNYRSKLEEIKGPSRGTPVIYNEEFARLALAELG